jgi:hypothetical protein
MKINLNKVTIIVFLTSKLLAFFEGAIEFFRHPGYTHDFMFFIAIIYHNLIKSIFGFTNDTLNVLTSLLIIILCILTLYINKKNKIENNGCFIQGILVLTILKFLAFILFYDSGNWLHVE